MGSQAFACVNPGHAREIPLPGESPWMCGIVEKVICHPERLELRISTRGNGAQRVFVDHAILDRYGFGDASSLAERVVFFSQPDDQGPVHLLPAQRRVDNRQGSAAVGWLRSADCLATRSSGRRLCSRRWSADRLSGSYV
jgi:hypothetical protein